MKQLIIGWGNPIAGDDGIGPRAAELAADRVGRDVDVVSSFHGGLRLVDRMRGYDRVLIADVHVCADKDGLSIRAIRPRSLGPMDRAGRHDGSLIDALGAYRALGATDLPEEIVLISAPVVAPAAWNATLSAQGEAMAARLADALIEALEVTVSV